MTIPSLSEAQIVLLGIGIFGSRLQEKPGRIISKHLTAIGTVFSIKP